MDDAKIKEIKDLLNQLPEEQRKYAIFKIFRDLDNKDFERKILDELSKDFKGVFKPYFLAGVIRGFYKDTDEENKEIKEKILVNYKKILEYTKSLALELKFDNSLELCNFYTYLMWNGYFSKDKKLTYRIEDRINIHGSYSSDIMNGTAVCLNFSDMLTDFINEFDYSAATVINYMNNSCDIKYKPKIERNKIDPKLNTKLLNFLMGGFIKKTGNHAFNLINESGKLYIYDSTNLALASLISKEKASLVSGNGEILLKPYFSYALNHTDKASKTLDLLHETISFNCPYGRGKFSSEWQFCLELCENKKSLLDDFYEEIRSDIENISEIAKTAQKVKKR